ncbi:RhoGAP domain-containing protein [Cavenderia fasciculata]|uniref:RhoGAP domain-containing protein n=1 Tax=Cavenderia fasciculata TaxID=261658 RepID=F4PQV5_CACFS|nr:RhoGAP domain-containing protein [Cavenderia fasciculata]EGG21220.1 RhoGAP domain-containing protein [Cavenderia fasciculata]|eukprot:XP_004359070.1 RhoGAP domain-containing protein [Cavenderia fasciculata]
MATTAPATTTANNATAVNNSAPKYKFSDNLWDGFDLLCKKTESDLSSSKNILLFFKKRAELEDQHAKKLEKLVSKLINEPVPEINTVNSGWKKIVNATFTESENHTLLNTNTLNKVCQPFQAMIKDMENKRKKIVNEGVKLRADMKEMVDALKKSQAKYEKVSKDLEMTKLEIKDAREFADTNPDTITKLERRRERLEQEQAASDDEYKEQIKATNDFQHLFNVEKLPKILSDFEGFMLQHTHLTKTYWTNWSNILKEQPPLFQQSYDGVRRTVEQIDSQIDVQEFIKKNQMKKVVTSPYQYEPYVEGRLDKKKSSFAGFNTLKDQFFKKRDDGTPNGAPAYTSSGKLAVKEAILPTASFGVNLEELMAKQKDTHPNLEVPRAMVVLAESITSLKGHVSEGIFRVPGIVSSIKAYKLRIDQGNFDLSAIDDVRTPAALFKQWLRDIPEPIIPDTLYKSAIDNPAGSLELIKKIPPINLKVLTYLIHFVQIFTKYEFVAHSKMGTSNMGMIFAPTILRCPSNDPSVLLQNVNHEKAFAESLFANFPQSGDFLGLPVSMSDALKDEDDIEELQMDDDESGPDSDNEIIHDQNINSRHSQQIIYSSSQNYDEDDIYPPPQSTTPPPQQRPISTSYTSVDTTPPAYSTTPEPSPLNASSGSTTPGSSSPATSPPAQPRKTFAWTKGVSRSVTPSQPQ